MAKITLNNLENVEDLICFNTTPNIITIENTGVTETKAQVYLDTTSLYVVYNDQKGEIKVNGYSITATGKESEVGNRKFYSTTPDNLNLPRNPKYCALTMANALRSVPQLAMDYDIVYEGDNTVSITAKEARPRETINVEFVNISGCTITKSVQGNTTDNLVGKDSSKIYMELYVNTSDDQRIINSNSDEENYTHITTLQKEYYKDSVSFNVTPVLAAYTDYGKTTVWKAKIYGAKDGVVSEYMDFSNNYITKGYLVNQGGTFINANTYKNQTIPALNVKRGESKNTFNNSLLYVYEPLLKVTLYKNNQETENVTITYLESDETVIFTDGVNMNLTATTGNMRDCNILLNEEKLRDSYYVDLQFSFGTLRYNVINPPYSQVECNRVYWYNSYGGVSFFDFVGDKSEERKTDLQTYKKSTLDFYKNDKQEQEIVYFRDNSITVSLTTHLIEKDGLYQLYDLQNSYKAWVKVNGVNYYIIVESISVDEPNDNVYTATIKYKYSLLDSFA